MEWYIYLGVFVIGCLVGFINTLAGSGTLLVLPLLMFLGLPATVANGTNRIGVLMQAVTATGNFRTQKVFEWKEGVWLAIPSVIGALIGAASAVAISEEFLTVIISIVLVIMFFVVLFKPAIAKKKEKLKNKRIRPGVLQAIVFFLIGLYGGFIQAGVGFVLLGGLIIGAGYDLIKANAIKVLVVSLYTPFALMVFIINEQVDFKLGIALGIGNIAGAFIASHIALRKGTGFVRYLLLVVIFIASLKLFGVFSWIAKIIL